jgi:hypothetical protein
MTQIVALGTDRTRRRDKLSNLIKELFETVARRRRIEGFKCGENNWKTMSDHSKRQPLQKRLKAASVSGINKVNIIPDFYICESSRI